MDAVFTPAPPTIPLEFLTFPPAREDIRIVDGHERIRSIIREQLQQYGSGPAAADLVRRHMEIVAERKRIAAFKA